MNGILIVDDDPAVRYTLQRVLASNGFESHAVGNGKEALDYLRDKEAGLVITDIIMPDVEGIELIRKLAQTHPHLPVMAISGGGRIGSADLLEMARIFGAQRTLSKPFDNDELIAAVRELMAARPPAPAIDTA